MAEPKKLSIQNRGRIYDHNLLFSNLPSMNFGTHFQETLVFIPVVKFLPYSTF